jgi:hypothetical protein
MGRGASENLLYGNDLRSLDRDIEKPLEAKITAYDLVKLSRPAVDQLDSAFIMEYDRTLDDWFYDIEEAGIPLLMTIDQNSDEYLDHLQDYAAHCLKMLAKYKSNTLNKDIQDRINFNKRSEERIGWSDVKVYDFNQHKGSLTKKTVGKKDAAKTNITNLSPDLYKVPKIGDQIKVNIKEYLEQTREFADPDDMLKPPYSVLAKKLDNGESEFDFKLQKFYYYNGDWSINFAEGEEVVDNPILVAEIDKQEFPVLDDAFTLIGHNPEFGKVSVDSWVANLEEVDITDCTLQAPPISYPFREYSLIDQAGETVIEVKSPVDQISQLEINNLPDQCIQMADKIITEIQNKPNNDFLKRGLPKSKRKKRKQKAQLEQIINKYSKDQVQISYDEPQLMATIQFSCSNKIAEEITKQIREISGSIFI